MIILDTHTWIWWAADRSQLSQEGLRLLHEAPALGVCAISCWEVAMLTAKRRLSLAVPTEKWVKEALALPRIELLPLSPEVAVLAANLPLHGDPADRIIVATAIQHGAPLLTRDDKLRTSQLLPTIW